MRSALKLALFAFNGSIVAEALAWVVISITSRSSSEGLVYRFCAWFHTPAEAVRFFLFSNVENHPTQLDEVAMLLSFFGTALLQWFFILLFVLGIAGLFVNHHDARRTSCQN